MTPSRYQQVQDERQSYTLFTLYDDELEASVGLSRGMRFAAGASR
jgi:hypothetical protein